MCHARFGFLVQAIQVTVEQPIGTFKHEEKSDVCKERLNERPLERHQLVETLKVDQSVSIKRRKCFLCTYYFASPSLKYAVENTPQFGNRPLDGRNCPRACRGPHSDWITLGNSHVNIVLPLARATKPDCPSRHRMARDRTPKRLQPNSGDASARPSLKPPGRKTPCLETEQGRALSERGICRPHGLIPSNCIACILVRYSDAQTRPSQDRWRGGDPPRSARLRRYPHPPLGRLRLRPRGADMTATGWYSVVSRGGPQRSIQTRTFRTRRAAGHSRVP